LLKRLPLHGGWLWATLGVIVLAALFVRLGFWQLDRLQQRRAANAHLVARLNQAPVVLDAAGVKAVNPVVDDLRRGKVQGTYDFSQEIVLRNQALNGAPGVHVITPLHITGSDVAVLVDRGWIPFDQSSSRGSFDTPAGMVQVSGIVHASQARLNTLSPADPPLGPDRPRLDEWFRVDIPRIQQQVPYKLLPIYLEAGEFDPALALAGAPAVVPSSVLPQPDIEIDLSEGPHLSYAIQWFAFALIGLVGYGALFYQREIKPHVLPQEVASADPLV
jgi:surfeit locus 1 family protein